MDLEKIRKEFFNKVGHLYQADFSGSSENWNVYKKVDEKVWLCVKEKLREMQQEAYKEIADAIAKHKFSTDMDGWEIVPKLIATMELKRKKYFNQEDK